MTNSTSTPALARRDVLKGAVAVAAAALPTCGGPALAETDSQKHFRIEQEIRNLAWQIADLLQENGGKDMYEIYPSDGAHHPVSSYKIALMKWMR